MNTVFVNLTQQAVFGEAHQCGFVSVGHVKQISPHTFLHANADRVDGNYQPAVALFSHGKRVEPMTGGYVYDLNKQEKCLLCVRGMQLDAAGRPVGFLVEVYKLRRTRRHLRVVH